MWSARVAWAMLVCAVLMAGMLAYRTHRVLAAVPLPVTMDTNRRDTPAPERGSFSALDWSRMRGRSGLAVSDDNPLSQRFRLAGTFFEFTALGSSSRLAILDDLTQATQLLVSERDRIGDVSVVQILRDRVLLRDAAGVEATLMLTFMGPDANQSGSVPDEDERPQGGKFGAKRVGESRWLFDRNTLLRYYQDLRDQPERLVLLFDSLKPVYTPDHHITGYRLGVEGERDFFDAVGLNEGDIVRRVNNVDMTNRQRAEFFLGQFVRDDANAFVLEVERGGTTNKIRYEVR